MIKLLKIQTKPRLGDAFLWNGEPIEELPEGLRSHCKVIEGALGRGPVLEISDAYDNVCTAAVGHYVIFLEDDAFYVTDNDFSQMFEVL